MKSIESEKTNTESVWQFNEQSFKFNHQLHGVDTASLIPHIYIVIVINRR